MPLVPLWKSMGTSPLVCHSYLQSSAAGGKLHPLEFLDTGSDLPYAYPYAIAYDCAAIAYGEEASWPRSAFLKRRNA
jgi:hypothetical protein